MVAFCVLNRSKVWFCVRDLDLDFGEVMIEKVGHKFEDKIFGFEMSGVYNA